MKRMKTSETGQSMVEFALVLPLFVMILIAIVDFARIYHAYIVISEAGRDAARVASVASVTKTDAQLESMIETTVQNATSFLPEVEVPAPVIDSEPSGQGERVTVGVIAKVPIILGPLGVIFPSSLMEDGKVKVSSEVIMRLERF